MSCDWGVDGIDAFSVGAATVAVTVVIMRSGFARVIGPAGGLRPAAQIVLLVMTCGMRSAMVTLIVRLFGVVVRLVRSSWAAQRGGKAAADRHQDSQIPRHEPSECRAEVDHSPVCQSRSQVVYSRRPGGQVA